MTMGDWPQRPRCPQLRQAADAPVRRRSGALKAARAIAVQIEALLSEKEKMKLCMLGPLPIALLIMVIVYLPFWYR